jgi:uncharacterized membrane protein
MNILSDLFKASASVIALYVAILSIVLALEGRQKFVSSTVQRLATTSLCFLFITCVGALSGMIYTRLKLCVPDWVIFVLSSFFVVGLFAMLFSLKEILRQR